MIHYFIIITLLQVCKILQILTETLRPEEYLEYLN